MLLNIFRGEEWFTLTHRVSKTGFTTGSSKFTLLRQQYDNSPSATENHERAKKILAPFLARMSRKTLEVEATWGCDNLNTLSVELICENFHELKLHFGEGVEIRVTFIEPRLYVQPNDVVLRHYIDLSPHEGYFSTHGMRIGGAGNRVCKDKVYLPVPWKKEIKEIVHSLGVVDFQSRMRIDMSDIGFYCSSVSEWDAQRTPV